VRRRIVISLGVLLALCLLGDIVAISYLTRITGQLQRLANSHRVQSMRATLASDAVHIQSDIIEHLWDHNRDFARHQANIIQFESSLHRCGKCHHEPDVQARLDEIHETFDRFTGISADMENGAPARTAGPQSVALLEVVDKLVHQTTTVSDQALFHLTARTAQAAAGMNRARSVLWLTVAAALIFGGFVAMHLQRRLTKPVTALLAGIERVREGDLTHRVSIKGDEEFQALGNAFNQAYAGLKRAQDSMVQAEKMAAVGKLAAGVAHEVNNPLASISSVVQIMQRNTTSEAEKKQFGLIMGEIARISRIVRELLAFSRPIHRERCDEVPIDAILDHAAHLLQYDKRSNRIKVDVSHGADACPVRGDSDRLLLVFTNIMLNAFDALGSETNGNARLRIASRCRSDSLVVTFEDNGPGMDQNMVHNAFEPFFTTKSPGEGTGLGLWICYQIIENHDGTIRIDSEIGRGTTVTITLPQSSSPPTPPYAQDKEAAAVGPEVALTGQ